MDIGNRFGEFLRQKRQEKELTQKELSGLLFVSESAVSKWESGVARPDISLLPRLSEILGVSEHEIITASIDNMARQEKAQAKKWRVLSFTWSLFFYIAYVVALIPCFVCNLAIDKTLSWFWIVLAALILAFTFTNLPKLIKRHKLVFLPFSMYFALLLLLGVCCVYTGGDWFYISAMSVLLGLVIVFLPIYIAKYSVFAKIRGANDFVSCFVDFILINILLIMINIFTIKNGYTAEWWYLQIALTICIGVYLTLNLLLCVRFLKVNRFIKTGILLSLINTFLYLPPIFVKVDNPAVQKEIEDINILYADLFRWIPGVTIDNNIHLIICLSLVALSVTFLAVGIIRHKRKNIR